MKADYDFSRGKRGAVLSSRGKTRITIYLDDEIVKAFKAESERTGKGYQTLINESLAQHARVAEKPVTAAQVREILREVLALPTLWSILTHWGVHVSFAIDFFAAEPVDPARLLSKSRNTPFAGWTATGRPGKTIVGGTVVWPSPQESQKS